MSEQLKNILKESKRYSEQLVGVAKVRFEDKLKLVGGLDPYEIALTEWSMVEERVPPVGYEDIVDHLLVKKSASTNEEFKAVNSLDSHSQLSARWVREVATRTESHSDHR